VSADGKDTAARLVAAMWSWRAAAENFDRPRPIVLPTPKEIQLETVMLPRDAFFAAVEQVPAEKRSGASPPNRSPRTRPAFPQSCRGSGSPTPSSGIYALDWPRECTRPRRHVAIHVSCCRAMTSASPPGSDDMDVDHPERDQNGAARQRSQPRVSVSDGTQVDLDD